MSPAVVLLLAYAGAMAINLVRGRRVHRLRLRRRGATVVARTGAAQRRARARRRASRCCRRRASARIGSTSSAWSPALLVLGTLYAATNQLLAARARLEEWV